MIVFYVPTRTTTCMILGLLPADIELLAAGVEPPRIHLDAAIREGIAIPSIMQIIVCADEDEFTLRVSAALTTTTGEPVDIQFGDLDNRGMEDGRDR